MNLFSYLTDPANWQGPDGIWNLAASASLLYGHVGGLLPQLSPYRSASLSATRVVVLSW
jgi:hypothetical protein